MMAGDRNNPPAPLADPLGGRLGYQLRRLSVTMMADLAAALRPLQLRPAEASILLLVGANPGSRQGGVGEALGIKRANMVPVIAALVKRGLVARTRADGRSHALRLTPKGRTRVAAVEHILDKQEAAIHAALGSRESARMLHSLETLRAVVRND